MQPGLSQSALVSIALTLIEGMQENKDIGKRIKRDSINPSDGQLLY